MLKGRSNWDCGAMDNTLPKTPSPTNWPTRGRWTPSPLRLKVGRCFQYLDWRAGGTRSFWALPIAACPREKVKRCRGSQTFLAGERGSQRSGVESRAQGRTSLELDLEIQAHSPQIRSAPDPKDPGRPNSPPPELLTPDYVASDPGTEFHS